MGVGTVEQRKEELEAWLRVADRIAADDPEHAERLRQVVSKRQSGDVAVAFCGHFSAGKSSLINALCGAKLLPSSPIPTSANIVAIRSGESGASILRKGSSVLERVPLEELAEHCRNGEEVEHVEITFPVPLLGEHGVLLDTPGVDSTDDAHRLATESALHMADVVFYVMDYNYVQSELNASFTKQLSEWGKPLVLVVNMIDKHRESELPFDDYRKGVRQAFADRGVTPAAILFVSVKHPELQGNELEKLVWLLGKVVEAGEGLAAQSAKQSALYLIDQHAKVLAERSEEVREKLLETISADEEGEAAALRAGEIDRRLDQLAGLRQHAEDEMKTEIAKLLESANVTPAATRDLAARYVESVQPGFKVGLLFSGAKTNAERDARLQELTEDLKEQAAVHIDRHLQTLLKRECEQLGLENHPAAAEADALAVPVTMDWVSSRVKQGATASGEYVLQFARDLSEELKLEARRNAFGLAERIAAEAEKHALTEAEALRREREALSARLAAREELAAIEEAERSRIAELKRELGQDAAIAASFPKLSDYVPAGKPAFAKTTAEPEMPRGETISLNGRTAVGETLSGIPQGVAGANVKQRLLETAAELDEAIALLEGLPAMASIARSMEAKSKLLKSNRFTIALFGAFSAGKSSFANALMGRRALPVSPNPTTAAINRIVPPDAEAEDGTALVILKTREAVEADIRHSLDALGLHADSVEAALRLISGLEAEGIRPSGKPHYAFLKAVEQGWSDAAPELGTRKRVDAETFRKYVAEEKRSCFVERIDLAAKSPLSEQGIVLVDTPGADSVNARHTGVAFTYIKNADAVLFVTYYNHAFSQADRQFLEQLGRVKDSFAMDKMFFVINAADLASSEEELDAVIKHLEQNLLQFGIRNPRIYPVSSLQALESKLQSDAQSLERSGLVRFERDFMAFTLEELAELARSGAKGEMRRAADVFGSWIAAAHSDETAKRAEAEHLQGAKREAAEVTAAAQEEDLREIGKESEELLYYVKQRIHFKFGELLNLSFNPSLFGGSGSYEAKSALRGAYRDFAELLRVEFANELLATTLRLEVKVNALLAKRHTKLQLALKERVPSFEGSAFTSAAFPTPDPVAELSLRDADEKLLLSYFKNAKHFFEGPGKQQLRTELELRFEAPLAGAVREAGERLKEHYQTMFAEHHERIARESKGAFAEHAEGLLEALEMKLDLGIIETRKHALERLAVQAR